MKTFRASPVAALLAALTLVQSIVPYAALACEDDPVELDEFEVNDCTLDCDTWDDGVFEYETCWDSCDGSFEGQRIIGVVPPEIEIPEFPFEEPEPDEPPEDEGQCSADASGEAGANRFFVQDGNAVRQVVDLKLSGAVGQLGLSWIRHHNTRPRGYENPFGTAGCWRHNWQWELRETSVVTESGSTEAVIQLIYPSGRQRLLRSTEPGLWSAEVGAVEQATMRGDEFFVEVESDLQVVFRRSTAARGGTQWIPRVVLDRHGLETQLGYDASERLVQVTEPAGRSLRIHWSSLAGSSQRRHRLGEIVGAQVTHEAILVAIPERHAGRSFRRLRLMARDGAPLAVSEIQVLGADGAPIAVGATWGTNASAAAAIDSQAATLFAADAERPAFVGLDFGEQSARAVSAVRILPAPGRAVDLVGAVLDGYEDGSDPIFAVSEVHGSDGHGVTYLYGEVAASFGAEFFESRAGAFPQATFPSLEKVLYDDETTADYQYASAEYNSRPMLVQAGDPRYSGKLKRVRYSYQPSALIGHGAIHLESDPETGAVYSSLELDARDPLRRIVSYSDLKQEAFQLDEQARRVVARTDSLGRSMRFDYAKKDGIAQATGRVDHAGRRTEFDRDGRGRLLQRREVGRSDGPSPQRSQAGGTRSAKTGDRGREIHQRDGKGRIVQQSDRHGRETVFERDAKGRIQTERRADGKRRQFEYNDFNQVTAVRTGAGEVTRFSYDGRGRRTSTTLPSGAVVRFAYDAADRVAEVTNPASGTTRLKRNARGQVTRMTLPSGATRAFSYDAYGRKTSQTDERGLSTHWTYDPLGRVLTERDHAGRETRFDYTELPQGCGTCSLAMQPSRVTRPDGTATAFLYDTAGRLLARTEAVDTPQEATTAFEYDEDDNLIATTDPLGRITHWTYDDEGRRLSQTDPLGQTTRYRYDDLGRLVETRQYLDPSTAASDFNFNLPASTANVVSTTYAYDAADRRIATTDAIGQTTRWTYSIHGKLTSSVDALGRVTRHTYDSIGRRITTVRFDGARESFAYDAIGRVARHTDFAGTMRAFGYDALGRLVSVTDSLGRVQSFTHDALGRRTSVTDALGRVTRFAYDAHGNLTATTLPDSTSNRSEYNELGQRTATIDALGQTTRYTYTTAGQMASLTDARGNTYGFEYDALGRRTAMLYPDGTREAWHYNRAGALVSYTNRSDQTKTIIYDVGGRSETEVWSEAGATAAGPVLPAPTRYAYDPSGRLSTLDNGVVALRYTYDISGRVTSETFDFGGNAPGLAPHTVRYGYDALGRRSALGYPDGLQVDYGYDAFGRLASVDDGGRGRPLASYSYDSLGRLERLERDNGADTRYRFDMAGQLTDIVHARAGQTLAASHYQLDTLGRRVSQRREDGITERYGHDATGQLTTVDYGTPAVGAETFNYDPLGNRIQTTATSGGIVKTTDYQANELNQYTRIATQGSGQDAPTVVLPDYDRNGNLLFDGTQRLGYDAQNRLVTVEREGLRAEFLYDARNRCVARNFYSTSATGSRVADATQSRVLTYDLSWNLLAERTLEGAMAGRYIHGARTDEILRADVSRGSLSTETFTFDSIYPLADGLGSAVALTTNKGGVTSRYRYTVFGQDISLSSDFRPLTSASVAYRFRFTGREWLAPVEINEHRNRCYVPSLGRWLTTDPIVFDGGLNIYCYVSNDCTGSKDPLGLAAVWEDCDPRYMPCMPGDVWNPETGEYGPPPSTYTPPVRRDCVAEAAECAARGVFFCSLAEKHPIAKCTGPIFYRVCMVNYAYACAMQKASCDDENTANGY